jgi:RNA polymerase sigma factor (sigma-70 family)
MHTRVERSGEDFAALYGAYWLSATGLARQLTRDAAAAEDIAAEGFARVWRQWETGRVTQPWGYLRKTVVNETISRARKAASEQRANARYQPPAGAGYEDAVADSDLVARLLDGLPPRQRRLLELRFLEDLSERETALRLGISVGAVKSGTSRALARLRAVQAAKAAPAVEERAAS